MVFLLGMARCLTAAGTTVLFDPATPERGPFPTDFLTVEDPQQKTGLRLNLPVPDCARQYTACQEAALLDQYDGFSPRARARVRFSGGVNPATLRDGVFFVALDPITADEPGIHKSGDRIAWNQVVYDPAELTAYGKPEPVLDQHRRYLLVVTDAVKDPAGDAVAAAPAFRACLAGDGTAYCSALGQALAGVSIAPRTVVAASLFTTMSATAWLEHARAVLPFVAPYASVQWLFRVPDLRSITLRQQTGTNPPKFSDFTLPLDPLLLTGLERVAIGSFYSPSFLESDQSIRGVPTGAPLAVPDQWNQVYFNALLPAGAKPPGGYPVVIFGHGFGDSRFGGPTAVAPALARSGFATIAINAVGHGFGPLSTAAFEDKTGKSIIVPAGGRGMDLNGDGAIEANEGCALVTPVAYGTRDCFRQTVVDLMQLARVIRGGIDLDGDGTPDLDASRIYYVGESLGAIYGTMFTALEPGVRASVLNVGGASTIEIARWSPSYHSLVNDMARLRLPPLPGAGAGFNEDYVLPDQPVKTISVDGAAAIQNVFETLEWLGMTGDPVAFAPHLTRAPLTGVPARPVLVQFARGDRTVPNPTTTELIRAAGLQASTWEYRHDLARALAPDLPLNPHPYLALFLTLDGGSVQLPGLAGLAITFDTQQQIAGFFSADGASIPDPNAAVRLILGTRVFEIPAALPVDFGY